MFNAIGKFIVKHRPKLIIGVTAVLFLLSMLNFYFIFEVAPQSNDECLWVPQKVNKDNLVIRFDFVKFEGVAWDAGIRDGDYLKEINDQKIKSTFQAQVILNKLSSGDSAKYLVERNGEEFTANVKIKKLYSFQGIGFALLGLIWLIVGFVIIKAKPEGYSQLLFFRVGALFVLVSLLAYFTVGAMQNPLLNVRWLTMSVDLLWLFGSSYLPFLLVHFFWIFPAKFKLIDRKYTLKILYVLPFVLLIISIVYRFILYNVFKISFFQIGINYFFMYSLPTIFMFIAMVVGLVSLFINYLRLKTKKERDSIFVILIAYFIGVVSILYTSTVANALADTIFNSPEYYMPIIFVAIIPIAFGYSIFRYSLMDISDVVKNTILYGIATIGVASVYFLTIYLVGQSISGIFGTEYQGILAAIIFILFAVIFQSTKDRFQEIVTRKFYPEQFAYQKVLVQFGSEISEVVGLENILDTTINTFVDALKIKHFGIALVAEDKNSFELRRSRGFIDSDLRLNNAAKSINDFIKLKLSLKQLPVIEKTDFENIIGDQSDKLVNENIYTIIPLHIKSKIAGLAYFGLKQSGAQFSGKDLELLSAAVNQVAVAVENARLYLAEAEKVKLDQEIENAKKIQESLLPSAIPKVHGLRIAGKMIPAMQIGGDYYDFVKVSDSQLFVVIGDVSGKGLSASFYMSKLQTMIRLFCREGKSPKEILSAINKNIFNEMGKNWFITVTLALFDTDKMEASICRAGHPPITILQNNEIKEYRPSGIGLGLEKGDIFDASLTEEKFELSYGQLFVFYSDGLTEAMNSNSEFYGEGRLKTCLLKNKDEETPAKILDSIINSVDNFIAGDNHSDDITITLIKVV